MQIRFTLRQRPYVLTVFDLAPEPEPEFRRIMRLLDPFLPLLGGVAGWYYRDRLAKSSRRQDRMAGLMRGREKMREDIAEAVRNLAASGQIPREVVDLLAPFLHEPGAATDTHDEDPGLDAHGLKILLEDVEALVGMASTMNPRTMETLVRGKLAMLRSYHGRSMIDDELCETLSQKLASALDTAAKAADKAAREQTPEGAEQAS